MLTHEILPLFATASIYIANRHLVSPDFINSLDCVPMAFTAESPPAQGQKFPSPPSGVVSSSGNLVDHYCAGREFDS